MYGCGVNTVKLCGEKMQTEQQNNIQTVYSSSAKGSSTYSMHFQKRKYQHKAYQHYISKSSDNVVDREDENLQNEGAMTLTS